MLILDFLHSISNIVIGSRPTHLLPAACTTGTLPNKRLLRPFFIGNQCRPCRTFGAQGASEQMLVPFNPGNLVILRFNTDGTADSAHSAHRVN